MSQVSSVTPIERSAAQIIERWIKGGTPDALQAMADTPELATDKSILLDLAFAEFILREERGEKLDLEEYCARFPNHHASLGRLLAQQSIRDVDNVKNTVDIAITPVRPEETENQAPRVLDTHPAATAAVGSGSGIPAGSGNANPRGVWPEPGVKVGDFNLVRAMGKGAFGRVFLALEETVNRHVVVKLSKQKCDEAKVLGQLGHKNVVSVLSAPRDVATGFYIVVMPYLGSATLEDLIELAYPITNLRKSPPKKAEIILAAARRNHQSTDPNPDNLAPEGFLKKAGFLDGIVWIGIRLAEALAAVHRSGFLHHDLKPSNVLLGLDGQPRLLDFNLASDVKESKSRLGGTLPYMAPEHLKSIQSPGEEHPPMDFRGDLFSFGVILYELVTGIHPFGRFPKSRSVKALASDILSKQKLGCKPVRQCNPEVSARLARAIDRCLAFNPKERFLSAEDLAIELRGCYTARKRVMEFACSGSGRTLVTASAIGLISGVSWMVTANASETVVYVPEAIDHRAEGLAFWKSGRPADALHHLRVAIGENPNDPELWLASGRSRIAVGEHRAALNDLKEAVKLRPTHGPSQATLAWLHAQSGNYDLALTALSEAVKSGYDTVSVHSLKAFCYAQRRLNILAHQEIEHCLQRDPENRAASLNLAYVRMTQALTKNEPLKKAYFDEVERVLAIPGQPDFNIEHWAAYCYMRAAQVKKAGPDLIDPAVAKARGMELLKKAIEHGYPTNFIAGDSTVISLYGDLTAEIANWAKPQKPTTVRYNSRMGDALTDFAG